MANDPDMNRRTSGIDHPGESAAEQDDWGLLRTLSPSAAAVDPFSKELVKRALFPRLRAPLRIGRFTVLGRLGSGGMGVVYTCYDDQLDRKVAVKVLHSDVVREPLIAAARLLREAQAMARLSHPNIVTVHEVGQDRDRIFVAMEFIRGVTLDVWAARAGGWRAVLAAFVQAGHGLEAAHRAGLVHRDFKPQNVIVADDGAVKVLDFGLVRTANTRTDRAPEPCRPERPRGRAAELLSLSLTRVGASVGTPAYMSPEQHRGEQATAASDQFSFCAALYQCLYGTAPFAGKTLLALTSEVLHGRVVPPPQRSPVSPHLFKVIRRGLAGEPGARFASMADLLAELAREPGARYRRGGALALTAVLTGAAGFVASAASVAQGERCPDARAELAGVWDEERAATLREVLTARDVPRAEALLADLEPQLDRYAEEWVQQRDDACHAHADARQIGRLFDLRTACLDQRRASLDALVSALAVADAATLDGVVEATRELPALAPCADAEALMAAVALPDDLGVRQRVQAQREALARAQVQEDAGRYHLGLQLVAGVRVEAQSLGYAPLMAEAQLREGSLRMESGEHAAAERALDAALWTGISAGHDVVAAQASSKLAYLRAVALGRPLQAQAQLALTDALNQRVRRDVDLYAEYLNNVGVVAAASGDLAGAARRFGESAALREQHGRADTPKGLETLANLGWLARAQGRFTDMVAIYRRAAALSERLLGAEHSSHVRHALLLADGLWRLGRPREALAGLRRLAAIEGRVESGFLRGMLARELGMIEREEGDLRAAREQLERALQLAPEASEEHVLVLIELMHLAAAEGDAAGVQAHHDRALRRLERASELIDGFQPRLRLEHARALGRLGRTREAVHALEPLRAANTGAALQADELPRLRGALHRELGAREVAEHELQRALAASPSQGPQRAEAMHLLGELALDRRRFSEARDWLARALTSYAALAEPDHVPLARVRFAYARALTGDATTLAPDARTHAVSAQAALVAGSHAAQAQVVAAWLDAHADARPVASRARAPL